MEKILTLINSICQLPDELELHLRKTLQRGEYAKKHKLLRPGQLCNRLYFVERGLLRCYVKNKKNQDITTRLLDEGDIAIAVISFFTQTQTEEGIEVLKNCLLWSISWQELEAIYEQYPQFRKVGQYFTQKYYCEDDRIKIKLLMKETADFYGYMLNNYPQLVRRVPNKYLATHLGVTPQRLLAIIKERKQDAATPKT